MLHLNFETVWNFICSKLFPSLKSFGSHETSSFDYEDFAMNIYEQIAPEAKILNVPRTYAERAA
jgi:hypothetical protein